jgi:hypothetical protein
MMRRFHPADIMIALCFLWGLLLFTGTVPERANKLFVVRDPFVIAIYLTLPLFIALAMFRHTPTSLQLIALLVVLYMLTVAIASFYRFPGLTVLLFVIVLYESYILMPRLNKTGGPR